MARRGAGGRGVSPGPLRDLWQPAPRCPHGDSVAHGGSESSPPSAGPLAISASGSSTCFSVPFSFPGPLRSDHTLCEHAVPLLWRFHALHHSDPDVDVTTSVRHHPVEYVGTSAVCWLAVLVLDIPVLVVVSHGLAVFATAAVQHGNIRLPEQLEGWLQPVLVTVDMHRIHHSVVFDQANSNCGAIFTFGTGSLGPLPG
jgi:hypothetical protein